MTKRSNTLVAVLGATALLAQLTACGDDKNPPGGPGNKDAGGDAGVGDTGGNNNNEFNAAMAASRLATAQCQFTSRCEPALFTFLGETEGSCITESTESIAVDFNRLAGAIQAGRVLYSAQAFDRCIAALGTVDCIAQLGNECDGIFTGMQAMNAPCFLSTECGASMYCDTDATGLCGRCALTVGLGADCSAIPCGPGLSCAQVSQQGDVACVPSDAQENATCGTLQTGFCRGRLQCVGDQNGATCRRPAGNGMACDPMLATGPDCNIYQTQACVNGMCANASFGQPGMACNGTMGQFCNGDSLGCNPQAMTCDPLPTAGQGCPDGFCGADAYCDGMNCLPQKTSGSSCEFSAECQALADYCIHTSSTTPGSCAPLNWRLCN